MSQYSIWVLEYSYAAKHHKSAAIYGAHNQGYMKLPYCYALIKGNGHIAMVDVGYNHKAYGKHLGEKFGVENWHSPKTVLNEIGLSPEGVDTVFITHAHFDHFGNVEDFPNAKFFIQEREIAKWTPNFSACNCARKALTILRLLRRWRFVPARLEPCCIERQRSFAAGCEGK